MTMTLNISTFHMTPRSCMNVLTQNCRELRGTKLPAPIVTMLVAVFITQRWKAPPPDMYSS